MGVLTLTNKTETNENVYKITGGEEILVNKEEFEDVDLNELMDKLNDIKVNIKNTGTKKDLKFFYMILDIVIEIVDLLVRKNHDYGDENLVKHGLLGIIVRLDDKLSRLNNLYKKENKNGMVTDEKIEDTIKDIIGYGLNSLRLMREGRI